MQSITVCTKCKSEYLLVGYPNDIKTALDKYKCNACKDSSQVERIRLGLIKLVDPETGSRYTKDKIELRVSQWLVARNKFRSDKGVSERPK